MLRVYQLTVLLSRGMQTNYHKTRRATFNLTVHLVFVTKYRQKVFTLIANMKSTSSKIMWETYPQELQQIYWRGKRVLWTGAYFVASCGGVTIEQLKKYVENQDSPDY